MILGWRAKSFVLVLASLPVFAWVLVLRPDHVRNARMVERVEMLRTHLKAMPAAIRAIDRLQGEADQLDKANDLFRAKLPVERDLDKVLQETCRLADANKLVTKSIRTVDRAKDGAAGHANSAFGEQAILAQVEGDFHNFYKFLLDVENYPRVIRIQRMDLTPSGNGPPGHIEANLVMTVFFEAAANRGTPSAGRPM